MEDCNNQADVCQFMRAKQHFEGAMGTLKVIDSIRETVIKYSAILINPSTVLTLAKYVYDNSTASFFPHIQFATRNGTRVYHVVESYLISSPDMIQNNEGLINYALLKLDKTIDQNSSQICHFAAQSLLTQKRQLQISKQLLKEELEKANLSVSELEQKVNDFHALLQEGVSQLYAVSRNYMQRDAFGQANQILDLCLRIKQNLYGQESFETINILGKLAHNSEEQSPQQSIQYYLKIIRICQKYDERANQIYVKAHHKLGSLLRANDQNSVAIRHLEEALHIYAEKRSNLQRKCAKQLMEVLYESDFLECAEKIKQQYRF